MLPPSPGQRLMLGLTAAACLALSLAPLGQLRADRLKLEARQEEARRRAFQEVDLAAAELSARFRGYQQLLAGVVDDVAGGKVGASGDGALPPERLEDRSRQIFGEHPSVVGVGVVRHAPRPERPAAQLWTRTPGGGLVAIDESLLDLRPLTPETAWYHLARFDGPGWRPPYMPPDGVQPLLVYTAPVCTPAPCDLAARAPERVATLAVSLEALEQSVRGLNLSGGSEAMLVTGNGELVVHPRMDLVRARATLHRLAWIAGDPVLGQAAVELSQGRNGIMHRVDPATGRGEHLVWRQVADSGHALVVHVPDVLLGTVAEARHDLLILLGQFAVSFFFGILLISLVLADTGVRLAWGVVIGLSATALVAIASLWLAAATHPDEPAFAGDPVVSASDLRDFELDWAAASKARDMEPPRFVRTGIFIQSIEFQSANNVTVTGMVWQHLDPARIDPEAEAEPGFHFPEADPGEELVVELAYEREERSTLLRGWRFRALLRQDFDYLDYPFDVQDVWIRIVPKEFDRNVVLVPDLIAYDRTARAAMPGLEPELVLPGWNRVGAGFSYRNRAYDTDFGITGYEGQGGFPELMYSVRISRAFLGPFVGKVIPLAVAASMLFCMLLLGTRDERYEGRFGFSAMEVVLGAAALFFVVIFDHSALREDLATNRPFYLEYFYFMMYLALVGVCVNAIVFAMGRLRWLQDRDNLLPKLSFWPLYLGCMAAVTGMIFW